VNGSEAPLGKHSVFRGAAATEVKVHLMPAQYRNMRTAKASSTYRLVYAETTLGSTQAFQGAYEFYGEGVRGKGAPGGRQGARGQARNFTAPEKYETWVKEGSWAEQGAVNEVRFTLDMPLTPSRVSIVVGNAKTFLDLCAQVGGVLGLLAALLLLGMGYIERAHDRRDPIGSVWSEVHSWLLKQRKELREKWNPESDAWKMENINKMQRREEKREGGARKVEDGALSNFKDLYSRNAVSSMPSQGHIEDDVEEEEEADTGVF
jgi:hypothetical protein